MKKYVKFSEHNYDGETWNFYIPKQGNTSPLRELKKQLKRRSDTDAFQVAEEELTEGEVDILGKDCSDTHYMRAHNKLNGVLDINQLLSYKDMFVVLCKGGIRDFMA